ncbi:F0F1 ATP synthase subunit epsilon [Fructilactobacillus fructivorans]|uniref:F0F1 ATP synthase subunit epsilon n=1 Tax=Fructilactobacillus fructivorans TaxID=1614 RepID=UPI000704E157|nr:F0F1 ATP synthase subunit epsilon [Fructilactobacillus fructivorans]KRN43240.1 F0F1 ATP synthase subunit epsilon [Fructilactobacillus fructivorans]
MADNKSSVLTVSIVTPDGEVYSNDQVTMAVIETMMGDLGILANHVPVIASLRIGETRFKFNGNDMDTVAVNGGFAEFSNNTLTIVADSAERKGDIDVSRATHARERAEQKIKDAQSKNDTDALKRAQVALQRAVNRINVVQH